MGHFVVSFKSLPRTKPVWPKLKLTDQYKKTLKFHMWLHVLSFSLTNYSLSFPAGLFVGHVGVVTNLFHFNLVPYGGSRQDKILMKEPDSVVTLQTGFDRRDTAEQVHQHQHPFPSTDQDETPWLLFSVRPGSERVTIITINATTLIFIVTTAIVDTSFLFSLQFPLKTKPCWVYFGLTSSRERLRYEVSYHFMLFCFLEQICLALETVPGGNTG